MKNPFDYNFIKKQVIKLQEMAQRYHEQINKIGKTDEERKSLDGEK